MFLAYSLRNLWLRRASAASAAFGVAVVVFMLGCLQMFVAGIQSSTSASRGDPGRVVVLARGAQVEFASALGDEEAAIVRDLPGIARAADGSPAVAPELVSVVLIPASDSRPLNIQVRGISTQSAPLRPETRIVQGRAPQPGTDELMIGEALVGRFAEARVGGTIELRAGHPAPVVGVFTGSAGASSEIWTDFSVARGQLGRDGVVSSIRARLSDPSALETLRAAAAADARLSVTIERESDFNEQVASGSTKLVGALGVLIGLFGALAAVFGAVIALNGSVADRTREIGTLRALGFSPARIVWCLLVEALALALAGGLVGALASLALGWVRIATTSWSSYAMTVVRLQPSGQTIGLALFVSALLGVLGGVLPAASAARISPAAALKRA